MYPIGDNDPGKIMSLLIEIVMDFGSILAKEEENCLFRAVTMERCGFIMPDTLVYNLVEFINDIYHCVHGHFKYSMYIRSLHLHYIVFMLTNYSLFLTTKIIITICSSNDCLFCDRII